MTSPIQECTIFHKKAWKENHNIMSQIPLKYFMNMIKFDLGFIIFFNLQKH